MTNLFKKTGLGFLGLITLLICVSFMLPGKVHVSRSAIIKAPAHLAYEQVNTLKNWEKWSPWHQMDSTMQLVYEGPAAGPGAKYTWKSTEVGDGSLAITGTKPNQEIATEMNFGEMGVSKAKYEFHETQEGTIVTWTMDSDGSGMAWYWVVPSRYFNLMMDDMLGNDFEKGLMNLKSVVEKMPAAPATTHITEKNLAAQPAMTIKATCTQQQLETRLASLYQEINRYIVKNKLEVAGSPFAIYHAYHPEKIELEAGIPVVKAGKSEGKINATALKAGKVVLATHIGNAENTYNTHMLVDAYLTKNNLKPVASPYEVYVTQPAPDPTKKLTEIYYPVN